jgi:hypothetical protein
MSPHSIVQLNHQAYSDMKPDGMICDEVLTDKFGILGVESLLFNSDSTISEVENRSNTHIPTLNSLKARCLVHSVNLLFL